MTMPGQMINTIAFKTVVGTFLLFALIFHPTVHADEKMAQPQASSFIETTEPPIGTGRLIFGSILIAGGIACFVVGIVRLTVIGTDEGAGWQAFGGWSTLGGVMVVFGGPVIGAGARQRQEHEAWKRSHTFNETSASLRKPRIGLGWTWYF